MARKEPFAICRSCGNRIMWIKTAAGRNMPVDPNLIKLSSGSWRKGKNCYAERRGNSCGTVQSGRSGWSGIYFSFRNV